MPAYIANFIHALTYWPPGGNDGFGGTSFGSPVPLTGRWQQRAVLFRDAQGREVVSEAVVYVSQEVANGGYLYLGTSVAAQPVADAREIRSAQSSPALGGEYTLFKAMI